MTTASEPDTLAVIGRELTLAFAPLQERLAPGRLKSFLSELGLPMPDVVERHLAVVEASSALAETILELVPDVQVLIEAIDDEDVAAIVSVGQELVTGIVTLVGNIERIASALGAATSGLGPEQAAELGRFAETFVRRLIDFAIIEYLRARAPGLLASLNLLGFVDDLRTAGAGSQRRIREVRFDRFLRIFSEPEAWLEDVYGWGSDEFDGTRLFPRVEQFVAGTVIPATRLDAPGLPPALDCLFFRLEAARRPSGEGPPGILTRLRVTPRLEPFVREHALSDVWHMGMRVEAGFDAGLELGIYPPLDVALHPPTGSARLDIAGSLAAYHADGAPVSLFSLPAGAGGVLLDRFQLEIGGSGSWDASDASVTVEPTVRASIVGGKVTLDLGGADSFLQSLLPEDGLSVALDCELSWSPSRGLQFSGGAGLELDLPLGLAIGPITLRELHLGVRLGSGGLDLETSAAIGAALGPLAVSIERMGLSTHVSFPEGGGNAGPANLSFDFKPPSGIGLSIDSGVVTGAGHISLEPEIGRYSGYLSLRVSELAVTALGLLQTNLPQPGPEFSLLILITAEFPGIQVGYGFTINGLGGIFGLHRRIDADALREDVASGSVSALLDPGASLDNPGELISRLERYFPSVADHFVIGLSIQLRWVELVRLDIGVMIELPGPNKIVILGRAVIAIEAGDLAVVRIQLEVLGIIDFEEKLLSIDAALRDSSLLEIFQITGGAALRLGWGERPYAVMSIGGFHPEFVPEPAVVPVPDRVGLTAGSPSDWFYLRLSTYCAITTSSFQLGAAVEVRVNLQVIGVEGMLGFDALIVFDPFYFSVGFAATFRIKLFGISLAGVSMRGTISGPGPITFAGEVCIEILFISICWSGSFSIGTPSTPSLPEIDSVLARLLPELNPQALRVVAPAFKGVALRQPEAAEPPFHPSGGVAWSQGLVPLGVIVERLEGSPLTEPLEVDVSVAGEGVPAEEALDWFAPAAFMELTDAEALNRKSFERLKAGFSIGTEQHPSERRASVELEPDLYVAGRGRVDGVAFGEMSPAFVRQAALLRGARAAFEAAPALAIEEEAWRVHRGSGAGPAPSETAAHQKARHQGGVALPEGDEITIGAL